MDYLRRLITKLEQKSLIKGVTSNDNYSLTHLLFANDIILFVEDSDEQLESLFNSLRSFELPGLNINLSKSIIFGINVDNSCV